MNLPSFLGRLSLAGDMDELRVSSPSSIPAASGGGSWAVSSRRCPGLAGRPHVPDGWSFAGAAARTTASTKRPPMPPERGG